MKKSLWIMICFVCFGTASDGQTGYGPELQFGMARMHFQPNILYTAANSSYIAGYGVGGNVEIPVSGKMFLQTGIFISRKGDDRSFSYAVNDSFHESVTQKLGLAYAEIPLGVSFKTGIQGRGRLFFTIGVKPGYIFYGNNAIHASGVYAGNPYDTITHNRVTNGSPVYSLDVALMLAIGYELHSGWFLKFCYSPGINDIGRGGEVDKNRTLFLSFGRYYGQTRNISKGDDDLIDRGN